MSLVTEYVECFECKNQIPVSFNNKDFPQKECPHCNTPIVWDSDEDEEGNLYYWISNMGEKK